MAPKPDRVARATNAFEEILLDFQDQLADVKEDLKRVTGKVQRLEDEVKAVKAENDKLVKARRDSSSTVSNLNGFHNGSEDANGRYGTPATPACRKKATECEEDTSGLRRSKRDKPLQGLRRKDGIIYPDPNNKRAFMSVIRGNVNKARKQSAPVKKRPPKRRIIDSEDPEDQDLDLQPKRSKSRLTNTSESDTELGLNLVHDENAEPEDLQHSEAEDDKDAEDVGDATEATEDMFGRPYGSPPPNILGIHANDLEYRDIPSNTPSGREALNGLEEYVNANIPDGIHALIGWSHNEAQTSHGSQAQELTLH